MLSCVVINILRTVL